MHNLSYVDKHNDSNNIMARKFVFSAENFRVNTFFTVTLLALQFFTAF